MYKEVNAMKRKTVILALAAAMLLGGCGSSGQPQNASGQTAQTTEEKGGDSGATSEMTDGQEAQEPIQAVYLKNDNGELFVSIQNDNPFTGTIPEEILDEDGNAITANELNSGDVLEVYGNGVMLNSYPGQYPGITKLVRVEQQNQEYKDRYQEMLEQFCPDPDRSQPPEMSVSYRRTDAIISAVCDQFGYTWEYTDENGETNAVAADAEHVLQKQDLIQHPVDAETPMTLLFEYQPDEIQAMRWEASARGQDLAEMPQGESVSVEEGEEGPTITVQPGYIYQVTANWPEGDVTYGFEVTNKE